MTFWEVVSTATLGTLVIVCPRPLLILGFLLWAAVVVVLAM